jgi:hypothetical protein
MAHALSLVKIVSKLSPLVGNLIEFNVVDLLNEKPEFRRIGKWARQDPGFPDTIFDGAIKPQPGLEIKAWFPLATEITARFRDSQNHFKPDHIHVAVLAWLPEKLIYGRPTLIDCCVVSARTVAQARDNHYHDPPQYLVVEPEDTSGRTRNLQQTNTNGYRWQGTADQLRKAVQLVQNMGLMRGRYSPDRMYQDKVRQLMSQYPYRLDTNYAKIDRIEHEEIEAFKYRVLSREYMGMSLADWADIFGSEDESKIQRALADHLGIGR